MNIVQYCKKFGDDGFDVRPLGEVDSLIFCELSYLNFTGILGDEEPKTTLSELFERECERLIFDTLLPNSNKKLINAIIPKKRFGEVKAGYFCELNDEEREVRFAAVTFLLPDGTAYVAFRGTDVTLLGWKEDFNMGFKRKIPSQQLAVDYLEKVAERIEGDIIIGGHSKGGNLAVYSAVKCSPSVKNRITAVYNHDGPGFHDALPESSQYEKMEDIVHKTLPHDSLVGVLLHHTENYKVVVSKSVLILQHNPFAWDVKNEFEFTELKSTTQNSRRADRTLKKFMAETDQKTLEKFVNALFAVIDGSGAEKLPDFKKHTFKKIGNMKRAFKALPEEDRILLKKHGALLLKLWIKAAKKSAKKDRKIKD